MVHAPESLVKVRFVNCSMIWTVLAIASLKSYLCLRHALSNQNCDTKKSSAARRTVRRWSIRFIFRRKDVMSILGSLRKVG